MDPVIFRHYDIRGIVGKHFTQEDSFAIGKGILSYYLKCTPDLRTIIVGMDGRTHSPAIKEQIITAAHLLGLNVIDIGVCPTPVFYFAVHNLECASGIMITASHNPGEYNGFKLCLQRTTIWGKQVQEIRTIVEQQAYADEVLRPTCVTQYNAIDEYTTWLRLHFSTLINMPLNVVFDCGNGTGGTVLPSLIRKMGWQHAQVLFEEVDGTFPHHEADPTVAENLTHLADTLKSDPLIEVGIGLDGDCDRMAPLTPQGNLVAGDQLLALYSKEILKDYPGANIVYDVKASASLIDSLTLWGACGTISPCGHAVIKEEMLKRNALLAGELSCHFFFNDRYFGYDDGIYAALRLFEIMLTNTSTLDEMIAQLPSQVSSTEVRLACSEEQKHTVVAALKDQFLEMDDVEVITIDGIRVQTSYGWGLIRASHTQAVLSLRFESETHEGLAQIKNDFVHLLEAHLGKDTVKDTIERA